MENTITLTTNSYSTNTYNVEELKNAIELVKNYSDAVFYLAGDGIFSYEEQQAFNDIINIFLDEVNSYDEID